MAMASDPTQTFQSGRNSVDSEITGDVSATVMGISSPRPRRRGVGRGNGTVSSPRIQTVSSGFSEPLSSSSLPIAVVDQDDSRHISTCDRSSLETVSALPLRKDEPAEPLQKSTENVRGRKNAAKTLAWNNQSDGATEASPVIDATLWPVLSKSNQASMKSSSSSDFQETVAEGSVPTAQVTGIASPSCDYSLAPVNAPYNRQKSQKSIKRGGGNLVTDATAKGGLSELPSPRVTDGHLGPKSSSKDNMRHDDGQRRGLGSVPNSGIEHQQHRHPFRRGSGGQHPRGNGSRHHGYGGKRGDYDSGNQDWNFNRNFAGRGSNIPTQRPFFPGPPFPISGPVILPNMPGRPFGSPFVYPDVPSPVYPVPAPYLDFYGALHHIRPIMPMQYPFHDPHLNARIVSQIDFYFSDENIVKDHYLRKNMDAQGWVSIKLIASFKKVLELTENIQLILDALKGSLVVEVEGEKVRRRNDWMRWLWPHSFSYSSLSSSKSSKDLLSANLQSIALDDLTVKHGTSGTSHSPSSS